MQMLCKVAAGFSDVRCPVCGQGFQVYWTRKRASEREEQRYRLQVALRAQHGATDSADAHAPAFQLPDGPAMLPQPLPEPVMGGPIPVYN